MPVLIDTGPLLAYMNTAEPDHRRAASLLNDIWDRKYGKPISIDHVLQEGLTFIRSRVRSEAISKRFSDLFWGETRPFEWITTD